MNNGYFISFYQRWLSFTCTYTGWLTKTSQNLRCTAQQ